MPKIEFLMKWMVDMSPEEIEEERMNRLITSHDDSPSFKRKYVYREVVLDISPSSTFNFNKVDDNHVAVRTKDDYFTLKIPYHHFKAIYSMSTGYNVTSYNDYSFSEEGYAEDDRDSLM